LHNLQVHIITPKDKQTLKGDKQSHDSEQNGESDDEDADKEETKTIHHMTNHKNNFAVLTFIS
jgi:hypothetical protein